MHGIIVGRRFFFCAGCRNFNNDDATGNRCLWVCCLAVRASVNTEDLEDTFDSEDCRIRGQTLKFQHLQHFTAEGKSEGWIHSSAEGESLSSGRRADAINEIKASKLRDVRASNPRHCHLSPLWTREHGISRLFRWAYICSLHLIIILNCVTPWSSILFTVILKIVKS